MADPLDVMIERLAEPVHEALGGHLVVSTELRGANIMGAEITELRLHLDNGRVFEVQGRGLHAEGYLDVEVHPPAFPSELAQRAAEFVAADRARRAAQGRWEAAVKALMHGRTTYVYGEGLQGDPAMKEAVLAAFEAAGVEPFEALASVLCDDADIRRRHPNAD